MKRRAVMLCCLAWSCAEPSETSQQEVSTVSDMLFEAWDEDNDEPSLMLAGAQTHLAHLPLSGQVARTPWPGNHWAVHLDGINHRWDGPESLSPAEKFAAALDAPDFQERISQKFGLSRFAGAPCLQDGDCRHEEVCGKRRGAAQGYCVGDWWGICDGWSAAAILAPEPRRSVTHHGVHFKVNDIKALLSIAYQGFGSGMIGARCNRRGDPTCDASGRPHTLVHRSTNPGSLHVIMANFVGLQKRSFVIDRDPSYRVFNQPVSRYEVHALEHLDPQQANLLLRARGKRYPYNARASAWTHIQATLYYIMDPEHFEDGPLLPQLSQYETPMPLEYLLELDIDGDIIGGEWVGRSQVLHPDFAWAADKQAPLGFWDVLRPHERQAIDALSEAASQPL